MPTLRKFRCHVVWVDACMYDMPLEKSWAFACTSEDIRHVSSLCVHNFRHQSIRGTKDQSGAFLSSSSAEYPPALAQAIASVFAPKLTSLGHQGLPLQEWASLQPEEPEQLPRAPVCDGAGRHSSADCTLPKLNSALGPLASQLAAWLQSSGLRASIAAHIIQQKPDCPLTENQEQEALSIILKFLGLTDKQQALYVEPLRLNLLEALAMRTSDKDLALIPMLRQGVTTGVQEPIPSSFQWPRKSQPYQDFLPLEMCDGNWSAAEAKPSIVQALIDKEIEAGWVSKVEGGRAEALRRWPSATAVGKLNLVEAPGKDPRLVLDSTVCQVNTNCSFSEAVQLPTVSDVCSSFQPSDPHSMWIGASLDFKAAHKQVKVRPADQGLLLFEFAGSLYGYVVPLRSTLLSLLVATPWSPAPAHSPQPSLPAASQSLALRGRPLGNTAQKLRRPSACTPGCSPRLP